MKHEYDDTIYTPSELMRKVAYEKLMGACQLYNSADGTIYGFMCIDMECTQTQFDDRACEMMARLWLETDRWRRQARQWRNPRPAKKPVAPKSNTGPNTAPSTEG